MEKASMISACEEAAELMRWFDKRRPPISHKQAVEIMMVGIAITLKATSPDKKWQKQGVKLIGEMIQDIMDMLEYVEIARKEKL